MSTIRRVLVTGAEGNIGSAVCEHLTSLGLSVTGFSLASVGEPPTIAAETVIHGDTRSEDEVAEAMADVDAVVHLAALPSPHLASWPTVFATNVVSTFTVLAAAGGRKLRRAVIASSINAYGGPFNSHRVLPAYYPLDEQLPADLDDPYSLSKSIDEQTARMAWRHWGIDVVALRFPYVAPAHKIADHGRELTDDPASGVREGWSYLDVRDAARVVELSLTKQISGAVPIFVAAETTAVPYATDELLDRFAPAVPRTRSFPGREVPIDLTRARSLLGFRAAHSLDLPMRSLE